MAKATTFIITINNNPTFCGVGAGGIQFANGKAETTSTRLAEWFKKHPGYTVTKAKETEK